MSDDPSIDWLSRGRGPVLGRPARQFPPPPLPPSARPRGPRAIASRPGHARWAQAARERARSSSRARGRHGGLAIPALLAAIATLAGAGVVIGILGEANPSGAPSASPLRGMSAVRALAAAIEASNGEGSVHIVVHVTEGARSATLVQDAGARTGEQTVVSGDEKATVILVGGVAYIRGNSAAVVSYFGFPQAMGPQLANRWISFQPTDQEFSAIATGVTLSSALQQIWPHAPLTVGTTRAPNGRRALSISGSIDHGRSSVVVPATGKPLIVSETAVIRNGSARGREVAVLSRWGERIHLVAPAGAIPIASVPA